MSLPLIKIHAWGWRLAIFSLILLGVFYTRLWQPRRQIELHQKNFLLALEDRRWGKVKGFFAENYSDRLGYNRESATTDLRQVFRQFFAITIRSHGTQYAIDSESATVTANLTLSGNGPGPTDLITNEVNKLLTPWVFHWQKQSFFPWDWKLVKIDNPSLNLSSRPENF